MSSSKSQYLLMYVLAKLLADCLRVFSRFHSQYAYVAHFSATEVFSQSSISHLVSMGPLKKSFLIFIASMRTINSFSYSLFSFEAVDFRSRQALSAGTASISSSLRSCGAFSSRCSRWSRCLPLQSTLFSSLKDFFSQKSNSFPV